jgi:hypothetical protein
MPTYAVEHKVTKENKDVTLTLSEYDQWFEDNPDWVNVSWRTPPGFIGGRGDHAKPDAGFKEVLSKIADQNPLTPMAQEHGSKSSKDVKVREAVTKLRKKHGKD